MLRPFAGLYVSVLVVVLFSNIALAQKATMEFTAGPKDIKKECGRLESPGETLSPEEKSENAKACKAEILNFLYEKAFTSVVGKRAGPSVALDGVLALALWTPVDLADLSNVTWSTPLVSFSANAQAAAGYTLFKGRITPVIRTSSFFDEDWESIEAMESRLAVVEVREHILSYELTFGGLGNVGLGAFINPNVSLQSLQAGAFFSPVVRYDYTDGDQNRATFKVVPGFFVGAGAIDFAPVIEGGESETSFALSIGFSIGFKASF